MTAANLRPNMCVTSKNVVTSIVNFAGIGNLLNVVLDFNSKSTTSKFVFFVEIRRTFTNE